MKRKLKIFILICVDASIIAFSSIAALAVRCGWLTGDMMKYLPTVIKWLPLEMGIAVIILALFNLYQRIWAYAAVEDLVDVVKASVVIELLFVIYRVLLGIFVPRSYYFINFMILLILLTVSRLTVRLYKARIAKSRKDKDVTRVLCVASGLDASQIVQKFRLDRNRTLVCIVGDGNYSQGSTLHGIPIIGGMKKIPEMVKKYGVDEIAIAPSHEKRGDIRELLAICNNTQLRVCKLDSDIDYQNNNANNLGETIIIGKDTYVSICDILKKNGIELAEKESIQGQRHSITVETEYKSESKNNDASIQEEIVGKDVILPFEIEGEYYIESLASLPSKPLYEFVKRLFDILAAACALIVFGIPMIILAIIIRKDSFGRAIYSQERLGKNGNTFNVYKFRSMYSKAETTGAQWSKGDEDERITPVGEVIRKYRLDELPQLWNILKGDMSIVGPRPEREIFYNQFDKYIHGFRERLRVKQGLTGLAQVNGGYDLKPEEKIIYDVEYIKKRTLILDAQIILKTIETVFTHEGAK